MVIADHTED